MEVLISTIKVRKRVRHDLGDIEALVESMERCGQLNPITLTRELELVAGHRRLTAATRMGWQALEATIVDGTDHVRRLEMELEENLHRKDFSATELLEGMERLRKLKAPPFYVRFWRGLCRLLGKLCFWRRKPHVEAPHPPAPAAHA